MNALPRLSSHAGLGRLHEWLRSLLPVVGAVVMATIGVMLFPYRQLDHAAPLVQVCIWSMTFIGVLKVMADVWFSAVFGTRGTLGTAGARILLLGLTANGLAQVDTASYRAMLAFVRDHPQELGAAAAGVILAFLVSGLGRLIGPELTSLGSRT